MSGRLTRFCRVFLLVIIAQGLLALVQAEAAAASPSGAMEVAGQGPVVVLESGLGQGRGSWNEVVSTLEACLTVVTYDRPGLADSPPSKIKTSGDGEITFGAMQASLDIDYGPDEIGFTWAGFDEMTEVSGSGSAELQDDGSLQIAFAYHLGDEAVLTGTRHPPPSGP